MEKKLGAQLREVKNDLERIINKESSDCKEIFMDKIHLQSILEDWTTDKIENKVIRDVALDVYLELAQMELFEYNSDSTYFKRKLKKKTKNDFLAIIKKFVKVVDEELSKEERIDNLEEKLVRTEISLPNYDFYSEENIQEMIHDNARAIARLLVNNE